MNKFKVGQRVKVNGHPIVKYNGLVGELKRLDWGSSNTWTLWPEDPVFNQRGDHYFEERYLVVASPTTEEILSEYSID